jgi:hypothetical protein
MGDKLMAIEGEINPLVGASSLGAAQDRSVKIAGCLQIVDRESDVKRLHKGKGWQG